MFYKNLFCFFGCGGGAIAPFTPPLDPPASCGALGMGSAVHSLRKLIYRACRRNDLVNLKVDDVKDNRSFNTLFLKDDKTHSYRTFTVTREDCPFHHCQTI